MYIWVAFIPGTLTCTSGWCLFQALLHVHLSGVYSRHSGSLFWVALIPGPLALWFGLHVLQALQQARLGVTDSRQSCNEQATERPARGRYHGGRRPSSDESSQSNRHPTIDTRQTEYHEALPSSANDEVRCDYGNASWYSVCGVPMVE